jgi:hypothetical protein
MWKLNVDEAFMFIALDSTCDVFIGNSICCMLCSKFFLHCPTYLFTRPTYCKLCPATCFLVHKCDAL